MCIKVVEFKVSYKIFQGSGAMKDKIEQIRQVHAQFIHGVVRAVHNLDDRRELDRALAVAEENGWTDAVRAARLILDGRRDTGILAGLDEEDHAIISGILEGLQNPATLPEVSARADGSFAAPGLASMIAMACRGNVQALQALSVMGEQMTAHGGDMAHISGRLRQLLDGERDQEKLTAGMSAKSGSLMLSILDELAKLDHH